MAKIVYWKGEKIFHTSKINDEYDAESVFMNAEELMEDGLVSYDKIELYDGAERLLKVKNKS